MPDDVLRSRLDHVAVAVADYDRALDHWRAAEGAGLVGWDDCDDFRSAQVRLTGGGKLELLAPPRSGAPGSFPARFLARFGPAIHHLTLKVADVDAALATVRAAGYDVVDVQTTDPHWREGFMRPGQVGGVLVQIAWSAYDDAGWAARLGHNPQPPAARAPQLLGVTLAHPDLGMARGLWRLLGATVTDVDGAVLCRWPDSQLDVLVEHGTHPGPVALRFSRDRPPSSGWGGPRVGLY